VSHVLQSVKLADVITLFCM